MQTFPCSISTIVLLNACPRQWPSHAQYICNSDAIHETPLQSYHRYAFPSTHSPSVLSAKSDNTFCSELLMTIHFNVQNYYYFRAMFTVDVWTESSQCQTPVWCLTWGAAITQTGSDYWLWQRFSWDGAVLSGEGKRIFFTQIQISS